MNWKEKVIFSFYVFVILAVFFGFFYFVKNISGSANEKKDGTGTEEKFIFVESGMGMNEIAQRLYEEEIIESKFIFKLQSLMSGKAKKFISGGYLMEKNSTPQKVITVLSRGPSDTEIIIFPGMTLKEVDEALSSAYIIKENQLLYFDVATIQGKYWFLEGAKFLEGFIFPDTYKFHLGEDINNVIEKFLINFEAKTYPHLNNLRQTEKNDILNRLIIASLLEKEVIDSTDQKLVAGILDKRLNMGMPLQVDATIIYAKCFGKFNNCPKLIRADFEIDSIYNTYKNKGLPPTPISNPELQAIIAALEPQMSEYLFYLSDPKTKKTIFSRSFEEHNINRAKYLGL